MSITRFSPWCSTCLKPRFVIDSAMVVMYDETVSHDGFLTGFLNEKEMCHV